VIQRKDREESVEDESPVPPLIVILAGGEGTRMGGGKPLRLLGGKPLIERALCMAHGWSDEVRVALRAEAQAPDVRGPVLLDDPQIWGPLAGLASGLAAARQAGRRHVLTLPCDMPFLPFDLLERLAGAIGEQGAAMAASGGYLHPVCALWRTDVQDVIAAYQAAGRRSLKGLAEMVGFVAVEWPDDAFANVNTPGELRAAERRLASKVEHVHKRSC
jgi:molybdopterin-guanine dinucleotide biosynthesis protein A